MGKDWRSGGCHCGAVRFSARLPDGLAAVGRCDCSLCAMRGAVTLSVPLDDFRLEQGADMLATYRFNTGVAEHHFCARCGIYTHHRQRADPSRYGINVACLDGVSPFDFREIEVTDGQEHPLDRPGGHDRVVGRLTFLPVDDAAP